MFFFFNDTATTEIYTLSLHDALPIYPIDFVCVGDGEKPMARLVSMLEAGKRPLLRELPQESTPHPDALPRSEEHTSELQSPDHLVCRLLLETKKQEITYR